MSGWSPIIVLLLGIQLLALAKGFPGECPDGECAQVSHVGSSLLSRRSEMSKISLNTTSEQAALEHWSRQFIETWIATNQNRQFTCQVTPVEVTPAGTEADPSDLREGVQQGLGIGATLMSAAGGLALTGKEFGKLGATGLFGVGGVIASTAFSVLTPFLFPDPAPPPPTAEELLAESKREIYTQMNKKVAELQACVTQSVGSTLTLAGELSQDLAEMAAAMATAAGIRVALIQIKGLSAPSVIQSKSLIVDDKCNSQIETFRTAYGSNRIVIPYLMASMRMCFGFYVGWALAEFELIQREESTEAHYSDVLTMMMGSMTRFELWFNDVSATDAQVNEYKRSIKQTKVLTGFLQTCQEKGATCKWFEPQTFYREVNDISDWEIKQNGMDQRDAKWQLSLDHDAELRCFRCSDVNTGIGWVPGGPDKFFKHHMWYNYNTHSSIVAGSWEGGSVQSFSPAVYICAYGAPTYYKAVTIAERNSVFDQAGQRCGDHSVPWLYWRTQLNDPALVQKAIVERKAARAARIAKIEAMPSGCQAFAESCTKGQPGHVSTQPWLASWSDLNAAVTLCCMAGHHSEMFCSKLAEELLHNHEKGPNVTLTDPLCNELEELTHIQESWEERPSSSSLAQDSSREASLAHMSNYLAKVHHKAGSLMQYLGGATLATSLSLLAGASTSGALVSALTGALVSNMKSCCEEGCETLTVTKDQACSCWLEGGGWNDAGVYVGPDR